MHFMQTRKTTVMVDVVYSEAVNSFRKPGEYTEIDGEISIVLYICFYSHQNSS